MQIVIDIDENLYTRLFDMSANTMRDMRAACSTIRNGTPLPKSHGRLIDADVIDNNIYDLTRSMDLNYGQISEVVDTAPTIIEADEVEE
jgi:hypothetical protein